MAKSSRKEISSSAFPFVRQFTAPPFFMGLEDAKLRAQLLVDAVTHSRARVAEAQSESLPVKKAVAKKKAVKSKAVKKKSAKKAVKVKQPSAAGKRSKKRG